jgi:hypothetical protein
LPALRGVVAYFKTILGFNDEASPFEVFMTKALTGWLIATALALGVALNGGLPLIYSTILFILSPPIRDLLVTTTYSFLAACNIMGNYLYEEIIPLIKNGFEYCMHLGTICYASLRKKILFLRPAKPALSVNYLFFSNRAVLARCFY